MKSKYRIGIAILVTFMLLAALLLATQRWAHGHYDNNSPLGDELVTRSRLLLEEQLHLQDVEHTFEIAAVHIDSSAARVDVQLAIENPELGAIEDLIYIYALHDGQRAQQLFREPSPDFYLYADQIPAHLLPPERLEFWRQLWDAENQVKVAAAPLVASPYKLPWTGGQRYRVYQDYNKHFDFSLPVGTQVRASRGGQVYVKRANADGGCCSMSCDPYNNWVRILHSDGTYGFYLHLKFGSVTVNTGDTVSQGSCLALSGNTGYSCGAHLHYNVATNGANDPATYVAISFVEGPIPTGGNYTPYSQNSTAPCGGTPPPSCTGGVCIVENPAIVPGYGNGMCDSAWYRWTNNRGYYAYLTLNTNNPAQSTNSATWRPNLPQAGLWKVEAYIANHSPINWQCPTLNITADTSDARYTIYHASGSTAKSGNQQPLADQWLNLGTYQFNVGSNGYVKLVDLNGEANLSRTVSFSAMRFTLQTAPTPTPTSPAVPELNHKIFLPVVMRK